MIEGLISRIRIRILKIKGVKIGKSVRINYWVNFHLQKRKVEIGTNTSLDRNVTLIAFSEKTGRLISISDNVYINRFTILDATQCIHIQKNVMIGAHCYITDHDHSFQAVGIEKNKSELPLEGSPVIIQENVWIGSNVVVLKGVTIGKNSVIGAGSVVTKSIPSDSVAVGNPCKVINTK